MKWSGYLVLCTLWTGLAAAGEPAEVPPTQAEIAERDRLSDEIKKLAKRGVWAGVERKYRQLLQMSLPLSSSDHLQAAYAAREIGKLNDAHERLQRAAAVEASQEIVDWLWDLDHNYGRVDLIADKKGTAELRVIGMPLDPNQRRAVEAAIETARQTGGFSGLLPRGRYEFATQQFKVEPGVGVRVEVSPKMRRQGMIEPVIIYRKLPTATSTSPETP